MVDGSVRSWRTSKGLLVHIRPLHPDDDRHLVDLFGHMGPESRFLRFNLALPNPDPELVWAEAQRMSRIDPARDGAWLVFADLPDQPQAPIAGVRYIRLTDEMAEASMAVRDDMQGQGIGSEMLRFLIAQARAAGLVKLTASVQRSNRALWRLLQSSGLSLSFESEGSFTTVTADLRQPEPAP
jgi:acetyltransferase